MGNNDPLTEAMVKHRAGGWLGMVLVGLIAAGVLAKQRMRRSGGSAVRG
jgi:hypothetical protein